MEISFLVPGLKAIDKSKYPKWFRQHQGYTYESGDIEMHYKAAIYDLPDGNNRRWDYLIIKLKDGSLERVVFAEPHPIKGNNIPEVLSSLPSTVPGLIWLKCSLVK